MPNILVNNNFFQGTSSACIIDLTPPTFAGVSSVAVQSRGQIRATWAVATDPTPPIRYEVYIKVGTNVGLFSTVNIIAITDKLQYDTFTMPDGSFLVNGSTYYVGVRAIDGVNNRDSNTVSFGVISTGVSVSADTYSTDGAFAVNSSNQLQGTLWALKNLQLANTPGAVMGTGAYQVYDKAGAAVIGLSQSGIAVDANGQYIITPVTSTLSQSLDHYMVRVTINVDGADRVNYVPIIQPVPEYEIGGTFALNNTAQLTAAFWISADEQIVTNGARLGTASYTIYDKTGALVSGMSETGIVADSNGLYEITPVTSTLSSDLSFYTVRVVITVDGVQRSQYLPIVGKVPEYESKAVFSINALNQFQGTLWVVGDGIVRSGASLGTASYTVYDSAGVAVSGLTQSGITADANGRFLVTPVSAILLSDLTHYTVKIGIVVDGAERVSYRGFTLLGT